MDTLLFGRVTYEQMAAFWPTPEAKAAEPRVAVRMNNLAKYVVSRTLDSVAWATTRLINDDVVGQLTRLKQQPGKSIAILGSSTLTASLLQDGLIDELRILVNPIILGQGYRVFQSGGRADRYEAYHGHVVPIRERAVALRAGLPSRLLTCRAMERPGASCTTLITGSVS